MLEIKGMYLLVYMFMFAEPFDERHLRGRFTRRTPCGKKDNTEFWGTASYQYFIQPGLSLSPDNRFFSDRPVE